MCYPFFALAFCAVFAPPHTATPLPATAIVAAEAAKGADKAGSRTADAGTTPAPESGSADSAVSQGTRGGAQKEGLVLAAAEAAPADQRDSDTRTARHDTEDKGDSASTQAAVDRGDTERK
jgi:hypothetical protein